MDSATDTIYNAFVSLLLASPTFVVALVGCVLVLLRRRRHPKASTLALLGFLVYLLSSVAYTLFYAVLPTFLLDQGWSSTHYTILYRGIAFSRYLVEAAALALLLAAVLAGRGGQPNNPERNFAR